MADAFINKTLFDRISFEVKNILEFVKDELIKEYEAQGHKLTGDLANTMRIEINQLYDGVMGIIWINDYYKVLDTGVRKERIPFSPGSGRKSSKYIEGLINYFRLRLNLDVDEAKKVAFATAYKHLDEGMPTFGSYRFSNNGKRLGFFTDTIRSKQQEILDGVEKVFGKAMNTVINEFNSRLIGEIKIEI